MKQNQSLQVVLTIIRIFVGLLFIFSGLIKANDPLGLAYKMGEFFEVWSREGYVPSLMHWFNQYALAISIIMIVFEIIAGVALIIGYRFKLFSILILLLTIFFTFLTAYAMFSGKIKECGCFGDCIKLQANESFMKDLILLALILILVFFRKIINSFFNFKISNIIMFTTLLFSIFIQWVVLKNLPFKDCLPYKVGNNLLAEMTPGKNYKPEEIKTTLVYKKEGVKKEFDLTNYPWQDTTWQFDTTLIKVTKKAENEPTIKDLSINNYNGENVTNTLLQYQGNLFLLFVKDVKTANRKTMDKLRMLISECKKNNIPIVALCSSNDIDANKFKQENQLDIEFFTIDQTICKTAMRTNPGLMLLTNGTVKGKWSYTQYPSFNTLSLDVSKNNIPLFSNQPLSETTDSTNQ